MRPRLDEIGMEWATFQVLRKTNASLSKKAGVDPKVASDQRGHGLGVSLEIYTSSDLEQKRAALRALEAAVRRAGNPAHNAARREQRLPDGAMSRPRAGRCALEPKPQPQQPSELAQVGLME
jgi:hypothetical protein